MTTPYYKANAGGRPIVVQGIPTSGGGGFSNALHKPMPPPTTQAQVHDMASLPQQHQSAAPPERGCRDVFFAILFYIHLAAVGYAAAVNAPKMARDVNDGWGGGGRRLEEQQEQQDNQDNNGEQGQYDNYNWNNWNGNNNEVEDGAGGGNQDYGNEDGYSIDFEPVHLVMIVALATLLAFVVSSCALGFMISCAEPLIRMALVFNIALFGILALVSFLGGAVGSGVVLLLLTAFSAYYACRVWARIPFAAANLVTAITAVRANLGLAVYAYWSIVLLFGWSIVWALSASATIFVQADCDANGDCEKPFSTVLIFLFFLSYYWTAQIIANVVHVTTAGTVGTWWFDPVEASGCCSRAVRESYGRSLTTSFGSICFGSLLVAIVQTLKEMVHQATEGEGGVLACVAVCLLSCIENLIEYFNKWAFVYVGLYGYSFMEAGSNVMGLFRTRGWTAIIADVMVDTVLFMVSLGVALLVGILSVAIGAAVQIEDPATLFSAFFVGLLIGYGVCGTLFSIVSSGVNTVIVCYAEAPNEFQTNHPELSERMQSAWRKAWPNDFNY